MKRRFTLATWLVAAWGPPCLAQTPEVIYTEIATSPTSDVPGALDAAGESVPTHWKALEDFRVSADESRWMLKGRNTLGSQLENTLVLGAGTTGTAFAQEGQPFQGGVAGEVYDFFDSRTPASFDSAGNVGYSARARDGVVGTLEKIVVYDAGTGTHTIVIKQGDPVTGVQDLPLSSSGDEAVGSAVGSVNLLDDGTISYATTPILNCNSARYPGFFRGIAVWRQSGVSPITTFNGADVCDDIDYDESGTTPDGLHWFIKGNVENEPASSDRVLVIDGVVVLQESFAIGETGPVFADVFQTQMAANGDWIARGDDPLNDDWVVHNGALVLKTGDPIGPDAVGDVVYSIACNRFGDWVAACSTTGPQATSDVLLLNGEVVLREGDPIDVDGNGVFDDGAFLGRGNLVSSTFADFDLHVTDDLTIYFVASLNDGAGNDLGSIPAFGGPDAFMRLRLGGASFCDASDGSLASCPCAPGAPDSGCELPQGTGGVVLSVVRQESSPRNAATLRGTGFPAMGTPAAVAIRAPALDPGAPVVFGDGLLCVGTPCVRLGAAFALGGVSTHTFGHGAGKGGGDFYYQLWFRSTPVGYCDATAGFNLSGGRVIAW